MALFNRRTKFVFIHIPKTGGTSLFATFIDKLGKRNVSPSFASFKFTEKDAKKLEKYQLISGHINWLDVETFFFDRLKITFLRQPLDRCLSWYYYLKSRPLEKVIPLAMINNENNAEEAISLAKQLSIDDFFASDHPHVIQNICNRQTWQLGYHANAEQRTDKLLKLNDRAKHNLKNMDYVGFTENFSKDVERLSRWMGYKKMGSIPYENKTPERKNAAALSSDTRNRILSMNEMDLELYEYAIEMQQKN